MHLCSLDYRVWIFLVIATWGDSSCSGGDWGDEGLLYVTGHDAAQFHVLRLPQQVIAARIPPVPALLLR